MRSTGKTFVSEFDEKIRRALRHQTRTSGDRKYLTGHRHSYLVVLLSYKRNDNNIKQRGGAIMGQDCQQVLVTHRSSYICVHSCCLTLDNSSKQFQYDGLCLYLGTTWKS